MSRFRTLTIVVAVAAAAAAVASYWAQIEFLPSIFVFVSAVALTGLFASLETQLALDVDASENPGKKVYWLYLVRVARATVLLSLGILIIVLVL